MTTVNSSSARSGRGGAHRTGALHRGVDHGPGLGRARHVGELGADVVAIAVQIAPAGAVDADAVAGYQVTVRDVVAVEVDGPFVAGGQMEAGRMAARQGPIGRTGGFGRRVGREIIGEPGILREVAVGGGRAGPRADQQKPRETADGVYVTHHITAACVRALVFRLPVHVSQSVTAVSGDGPSPGRSTGGSTLYESSR